MRRDGVSIVVAARDAETTLPALLAACAAQDLEEPPEVVVVDDGSRDGTRRVAEGAGVRVLSQQNRGPAAARNAGWRAATAPIVLFTDSDCVPRADWARTLSSALDEDHGAASGTYGIANPGQLLPEAVHAEILWRHARLGADVEFAGSYNLAVKRSVLEAVGGFDESYRAPSAEDNDFSYRMRDAGVRIRFVPGAVVAHHHPVSLRRYLREQARHGRWRVVLYAAHPARARGDGYAGPADLLAPPLALLSMVCALLSWLVPGAAEAAGACLAVVAASHGILAARVWRHTRSTAALLLAPVGTLRAYARGWGMLRGMVQVVSGGRWAS